MAGQVGLADPDQQDPRRSVIPIRQTEKKRIRRRRCCRLRNRLHRGCPTMRTQECENKCMFQDVEKTNVRTYLGGTTRGAHKPTVAVSIATGCKTRDYHTQKYDYGRVADGCL